MQFGPTFALFVRSIREENRSRFAYVARFLLVVIVLFFLWSAYDSFSMSRGAPGLEFFRILTTINAIFITLAGIAFFSTAITEEKEEMTLGLLRMTKLSPVAILLGKSTSRLFGALLLILSQLPFTLLAVSLGGVSQPQVFAVYASLLAWIFFLSNLALFCSVIRSRNSGATSLTVLSLILLYLIPAIAAWVIFLLISSGSISPLGTVATTATAIAEVLSKCEFVTQISRILTATGYNGSIFSYQVGACLVVGLAFFFLSWVFFNTFNREQKESAPKRGILASFSSSKKSGTLATTKRFFSPPRSWPNAVFWKDFYFFRGGWLGIGLRIASIALIIGLIVILFYRRPYNSSGFFGIDEEEFGGILVIVTLVTGALDLALGSGRMFSSEAKWKTLSGLIMLPMTTGSLAYQKVGALALSSLPYFFLVFVGFFFLGPRNTEEFFEGLFHPAGIYTVATFFLALHLTAFFSLVVKGGAFVALIVSICIIIIGNFFMMFLMFSSGGDEGVLVFFALCAGALCAYLQVVIGKRLDSMAAAE